MGHCWDALHDLDDKIVAAPAGNIGDVAIKTQIWLLRGNEDLPYLHYVQSIARDVIALGRDA
jgi:hypothetical protein